MELQSENFVLTKGLRLQRSLDYGHISSFLNELENSNLLLPKSDDSVMQIGFKGELYHCNLFVACILEILSSEPTSIEDLSGKIANAFDVETGLVRPGVIKTIQELINYGLINSKI